jgi:hydroxyacylglutathione hydrolase
MVTVKKLILGAMQTNCYLLFDSDKKDAIVIDPGDDADYIQRIICDLSLSPKLILATHGHFDHVLAVRELTLAYKIPFAMSRDDSFLIGRSSKTAMYFGSPIPVLEPKIDKDLSNKKEISVADIHLRIIKTPGHTPGSLSFYSPAARAAYTGDTLFEGGVAGRDDFAYADSKKLTLSINRLKELPKSTTFYPGHGNEFSLS